MLCFPRLGDYGYLGNAMFQYSALLGIANKKGYEVCYDDTKKGTMVTLHDVFNLNKYTQMPSHEQVHSIRKIWKEPNFHFNEDAFSVEDNVGLNGYFQSEKYFKHIEDDIRSEFKFSDVITKECESKISQAHENDKTVISIHVRLGDYKALEHVYIPLLRTPYYNTAIEYIDNNIKGEKLFVIFSDEINTCRNIFRGDQFAFAEGGTPEQDMCLMSMCDHNIISNSSFSWWSAWLNKNKDKKVIAPIEWFAPNKKESKDTKDLYCEDWIRL
ncbi:MAG: alpha-1,2-fucosyltransferase [Proteobacteria bacterium]|nr:alpha-1,2-fucosyltransferase [Pseudomonadota bacterium]